jgi:predicted Zn-dependent protease/uncharacterized protein YceK
MRFWLLALTLLCTGCGTLTTLGDNERWPNQIYAGTRAALNGHGTQLDAPLSFIADTLVLPYTIPRTLYNQSNLNPEPGAGESFIPADLTTLHGSGKIYFLALDASSEGKIDSLIVYFKNKYGLSIQALPPLELDQTAFDPRRNQLVAEAAISIIKNSHPSLSGNPDAILIGITSKDMYIRGYQWTFAFSWREGRFAVVSSGRMGLPTTDFISQKEAAKKDVLETRLRKMVTKNIGILYYHLPQSDHPKSVLYKNIGGIEELEEMGEDY